MACIDQNNDYEWLSLEFSDLNYDKGLKMLISSQVKIGDIAVFSSSPILFVPSSKLEANKERYQLNELPNKKYKRNFATSKKALYHEINEIFMKLLLLKSNKEWMEQGLDDVSFFRNGVEFLATIFHENYIFTRLSKPSLKNLNIPFSNLSDCSL